MAAGENQSIIVSQTVTRPFSSSSDATLASWLRPRLWPGCGARLMEIPKLRVVVSTLATTSKEGCSLNH